MPLGEHVQRQLSLPLTAPGQFIGSMYYRVMLVSQIVLALEELEAVVGSTGGGAMRPASPISRWMACETRWELSASEPLVQTVACGHHSNLRTTLTHCLC